MPTLVLDDGRAITESNAAMWYLAETTSLIPDDRFARAQVLQWMCFEQYSHEPYIGVARFWLSLIPDGREKKAAEIPEWHAKGHAALAVMEQHLDRNDFFAAGAYSIADIALYAYTHMADDGDFDLKPYRAIRAWLDRVAGQPGHIDIDWRPKPG